MNHKIRIGVSRCLLGECVRYDGGHKHDPLVTETVGRWAELVPICPEVEAGLGTPREPMRLEGNPWRPQLVAESRRDHTERVVSWARMALPQLTGQGLCGFILKSKSPSCAVHSVSVYNSVGRPGEPGPGLFTRLVTEHFPELPVAEESDLRDAERYEAFMQQVHACHGSQNVP